MHTQIKVLSAAGFQWGSLLKEAIRDVTSERMICNQDNMLMRSFSFKKQKQLFSDWRRLEVLKCCCCPLVGAWCSYGSIFRRWRSRAPAWAMKTCRNRSCRLWRLALILAQTLESSSTTVPTRLNHGSSCSKWYLIPCLHAVLPVIWSVTRLLSIIK